VKPDFSTRRWFPGETGNPFDVVLHQLEAVQRLPWPVFGAALFLLAFLASRFSWLDGLFLGLFFLGDWLLVALLPRVRISYGPPQPPVLILAILRACVAFLAGPFSWYFQAAGTCLVVYAFWLEPQRLVITRQQLETSKLPHGVRLRLLHIADLHVERITRREEALQRQIETLQPDLILFSGDVLNLSYLHDPLAWQDARSVIRQWHAPLGVFAVSGSPAVDLPPDLDRLYEGLPARLLENEGITIQFDGASFEVFGLSCTHRPFVDGPRLEPATAENRNMLRILLYHSPDLAEDAARAGFDLQLSGHTHGGQVRLPWFGAIFTGSLFGKRFEAGRIQLDGLTLYVSRGIGLEGAAAPRLRFLCPPEIIFWDISGKPKS
jgi:uncharacterized protein